MSRSNCRSNVTRRSSVVQPNLYTVSSLPKRRHRLLERYFNKASAFTLVSFNKRNWSLTTNIAYWHHDITPQYFGFWTLSPWRHTNVVIVKYNAVFNEASFNKTPSKKRHLLNRFHQTLHIESWHQNHTISTSAIERRSPERRLWIVVIV